MARAVRRADVQTGQRVLVVGAGPIGLAAMLFARLLGAEVTALDTREERLSFAHRHLGIAHAVPVGPTDALATHRMPLSKVRPILSDCWIRKPAW